MTSKILANSWLKVLYYIFGADNDGELCITMTHVGLIYTVLVGIYSLFAPAPYGRYQAFGPTINAKIGWVVQDCMSFIIPIIVMFTTPGRELRNYNNLVPLSLFILHYFHRSFVYPCAISSDSRPTPILTVLSAIIFTTYNGFLQSMHLANVAKIDDWVYVFMVSGTLIYITGMSINTTHDRILISLRAQSNTQPSPITETSETENSESTPGPVQRYKIPQGGLFEYVSGANYLGEIIEWIGFAVITRKYPQAVFALFTAVFLGIRAVHHHKFYKSTFGEDYPQSRKAIIPCIL